MAAVVACVSFSVALIGQEKADALYTVPQLNNMLEDGFNTALRYDVGDATTNNDSCKQVTKMAVDNRVNLTDYRQKYMNTSYKGHSPASYVLTTWLSAKGSPNTTNPVVLAAGATSIDLQINNMVMLCGGLVQPDSLACNSLTSSMYDDNRWVTASSPDRQPNPVGGACLQPAKTGSFIEIENLKKGSGTTLSGSIIFNNTPKKVLSVSRDDNSRYWFAKPIPFTYKFDAPLSKAGKIRIDLQVKKIEEYRKNTYRCSNRGAASRSDFGVCDPYDDSVTLTIRPSATYNLKPQIDLSKTGAVMRGETYQVKGLVTNNGGTASANTNWQVTRMIYAPGVTPPPSAPADGGANPCVAFSGYKGGTCQSFSTGKSNFAVGGPATLSTSDETANADMGAKICYATSVNTPTPLEIPAWRHSALSCVTIGKKPKINIIGGDVRTGDDIDVSNTSIGSPARWYGSWVEYGAFANGDNMGGRFGSGATLRNGPATLGIKATNPLTFANTLASNPSGVMMPGQFGDGTLGKSNLQSTILALLPAQTSGFQSNLGGISNDGRYDVGSVSVKGNNITHSLVINSSATVTISDDITYSNSTNPSALPQVIIIAKSIKIAQNVKHIDAWLLTPSDYGTFTTCDIAGAPSSLRTSNCNNQLQVNGPVVGKAGAFHRTAGSDSESEAGKPAETFSLPTSAYIWQYAQAAKQGGLRTVQITELPPRY